MKTKTKPDNSGKQVYCSICRCYLPSASLVTSHEAGKKHQNLLNKQKQRTKSLNCGVYVRGFQKQIDLENRLKSLFSKYGPLKEIYVDKEKSDYALVEFEEETDVQRLLLEKDKQMLDGKKLIIKPRKSHNELDDSERKEDGKRKYVKEDDDPLINQKKMLNGAFSKCKNVSEQMLALVEVMQLTEEDIQLRATLCELLEEVFKEVYPDCQLLSFGSTITHLGCKGCDLDVTLLTDQLTDARTRQASQQNQEPFSSKDRSVSSLHSKTDDDVSEVCDILRKFAPGCKNVIPLRRAHCPVIKFYHKDSGLQCDLSINNKLAVKNSELLSLYCKADDRLRPLAYTIRLWAKSKCIAGKGGMEITQYALVIMAISFLQQYQPPVLPCLQAIKNKSKQENEDYLRDGWDCYFHQNLEDLERSQNSMSYDELLFGFFQHFTKFEFEHHIISIRTTDDVTRKSLQDQFKEHGIEDTFKYGPVCILDPFELTHNIAQNMTYDGLKNFKAELGDAMKTLEKPEKSPLEYNFEEEELDIAELQNRCDLLKLFEPRQKPRENKRKRKLRNVFDVYSDADESNKDIGILCYDAILEILQNDLKMNCKIVSDDAMKSTIATTNTIEDGECLKRGEHSVRTFREDEIILVGEQVTQKGACEKALEDSGGSDKDDLNCYEEEGAKRGKEIVGEETEEEERKRIRKEEYSRRESEEIFGRFTGHHQRNYNEEGVNGGIEKFLRVSALEDLKSCKEEEEKITEDVLLTKNRLNTEMRDVSNAEMNRKRKASTINELIQPVNKLAKISMNSGAETSADLPQGDHSAVEIHATAWANTWTNRRQQRKILNVLKDSHSRTEEFHVLSTDLAHSSTEVDSSRPSDSLCSDIESSKRTAVSSTVDSRTENEGDNASFSQRIDATNELTDNGPIVVVKIRIFKPAVSETRCRISVEMKKARNLTDFYTFFAFFKKQVLLKFKRRKVK